MIWLCKYLDHLYKKNESSLFTRSLTTYIRNLTLMLPLLSDKPNVRQTLTQ